MYKDRGTIKWTALMLPEHVQQLRKWRNDAEEREPEALESWQLEELNDKISLAFDSQKKVSIFLYDSHWIEETGIISKFDFQNRMVFLDDELIIKRLPMYLIYRVIFHD